MLIAWSVTANVNTVSSVARVQVRSTFLVAGSVAWTAITEPIMAAATIARKLVFIQNLRLAVREEGIQVHPAIDDTTAISTPHHLPPKKINRAETTPLPKPP